MSIEQLFFEEASSRITAALHTCTQIHTHAHSDSPHIHTHRILILVLKWDRSGLKYI